MRTDPTRTPTLEAATDWTLTAMERLLLARGVLARDEERGAFAHRQATAAPHDDRDPRAEAAPS